jgi:hypothetical protein
MELWILIYQNENLIDRMNNSVLPLTSELCTFRLIDSKDTIHEHLLIQGGKASFGAI